MWVGIGCGGLFLLSAIGGGLAWYFTMRAAQNALAAMSAAAAPLTPPATPGAAPDAKPADGATDSAGGPVNGACAKAAECCRKIVQKSNAGAQAEAGCLALKQLTEATCQQPLQTYQQSAKLLGVNCD
jgi:hypothetical protein